MKVLIVDDSAACRKMLEIYFRDYGDCDSVGNGPEAVAAIGTSLENDLLYDLICLDIAMPEMNGLETLKAIRQVEKEHDVAGLDCAKAIMISSSNDKESVLAAFRGGCDAYIVKPFDKDKLLTELEKLELIPVVSSDPG